MNSHLVDRNLAKAILLQILSHHSIHVISDFRRKKQSEGNGGREIERYTYGTVGIVGIR